MSVRRSRSHPFTAASLSDPSNPHWGTACPAMAQFSKPSNAHQSLAECSTRTIDTPPGRGTAPNTP